MIPNEIIWTDRMNGTPVSDIAKKYDLTEKDVREVLEKAPAKYKYQYNVASRIKKSDFSYYTK